jgi:hypothetical protein
MSDRIQEIAEIIDPMAFAAREYAGDEESILQARYYADKRRRAQEKARRIIELLRAQQVSP